MYQKMSCEFRILGNVLSERLVCGNPVRCVPKCGSSLILSFLTMFSLKLSLEHRDLCDTKKCDPFYLSMGLRNQELITN